MGYARSPPRSDGGILITAVWDSQAQYERFLHDKLMAAMPIEGGFVGQPEARSAEVVNLVTALGRRPPAAA